MARFGRRALGYAAVAWLASACLSPTLPLPPPNIPDDIQQIETGLYRIEGRIPKPGRVLIWNTRTNDLAGNVTSGAYQVEVRALPEDEMQLWYETGRRRSQGVAFEIPPAPLADGGADAAIDAAEADAEAGDAAAADAVAD